MFNSIAVKLEVLNHCEDELFSIFTLKTFIPEAFKLTHRLLFHRKEDVRSKYRKIANTVGIGSGNNEAAHSNAVEQVGSRF